MYSIGLAFVDRSFLKDWYFCRELPRLWHVMLLITDHVTAANFWGVFAQFEFNELAGHGFFNRNTVWIINHALDLQASQVIQL